jgi:CubicO group peptidase (beta-lactamase class C family)
MRGLCVTGLAVVLLCLWPGAGGPDAAGTGTPVMKVANDDFKDVASLVNGAIRDRSTVSAAVGVAQAGKIVWLESFGLANIEQRRSTSAHTAYPIASLTKPLTATAVMILSERGLIDIDRPAEDYMGQLEFTAYKGKSEDVTVRSLLNHTSGLPMHYNYFYADEGLAPPPLEETVEHYGFLMSPPGTVFRYSNLGYGVLGRIVEQVSGMTFEEFMRAEVFDPLGMTTSWVGVHPEWSGLAAQKYGPDLEPIPAIRMDTPAAGEAFCCAYDLLRFGMFHLKNKMFASLGLLSPETIDIMQSGRCETAEYDGDYYGLGWFYREDDFGFRTVWHEGGIAGASCILKMVPDEDIVVVVLLNTWSATLAARIADGAIGVLLPAFKEAAGKGRPPAGAGFIGYMAAPGFTGRWAGEIKTYTGDVPVYMDFQEDGDIHFLKQLDLDRTWVLQNQVYFDRVLNNTGVSGDRIYGWVDARIPTPDAEREPQVLIVDVVRDGREMTGAVTSVAAAHRMYYALSHYVKLEKE